MGCEIFESILLNPQFPNEIAINTRPTFSMEFHSSTENPQACWIILSKIRLIGKKKFNYYIQIICKVWTTSACLKTLQNSTRTKLSDN